MGPTGKAYRAPPDLLAGFQGPLRGTGCKGGGRKGEEGKGRKKGRGGTGRGAFPTCFYNLTTDNYTDLVSHS